MMALAFALALGGCSSADAEGKCAASCSADGLTLTRCEGGHEVTVECLRDFGQLCEVDRCVDPWRYGAPQWGTCPSDPLATDETLAEKASYYDDAAVRLHLHPDLGWVMGVRLRGAERPCAAGESPPCVDPVEPAVDERLATVADVETWQSGENDGLWSALYLASQAFRYGATRSSVALGTLRRLLEAERDRMRITGVPGLFTRQYVRPGVTGLSCPTDDAAYTTDAEKDDNRWVQIRDDGCAWTVSRETGTWARSDHCGLEAYAGWCWLDNVSKDEYSGHVFGLAAVVRLVDDAEVHGLAAELLGDFGAHLVENSLTLVDWDGRVTEHGKFSPLAFDDYPGFNAAMALGFLKTAVEATGRADLRAYYDDCLLARQGAPTCTLGSLTPSGSFVEYLGTPGLYVGPEGCEANYNNISMHLLSLHDLLWFERDPVARGAAQRSLDVDVMRAPGEPRAILGQHNALFDFIWAAQKALGPGTDGPAFEAVEDGVCMLRQFRASQAQVDLTPPPRYQPYCKSRFDEDVAEHPRQIGERCTANFVWWGDPYQLGSCTRDARRIHPPTGYLLAYWMARYFGFVDEAQ